MNSTETVDQLVHVHVFFASRVTCIISLNFWILFIVFFLISRFSVTDSFAFINELLRFEIYADVVYMASFHVTIMERYVLLIQIL